MSLENAKKGDELIMISGGYYTPDQIVTVERVTPSLIVLTRGEGRFKKKGGDCFGNSSSYLPKRIVEGSRERIEEIKDTRTKKDSIEECNEYFEKASFSMDLCSLTKDQLRQILKIIKDSKEK